MWQKSSLTRAYNCGYRRERYDKSAGPERAGGGSLVVTSGVEFNTSTASGMLSWKMSRGSGAKAVVNVCGISQPGDERHGVMHALGFPAATSKQICFEVMPWTEIDQNVRTGSEQKWMLAVRMRRGGGVGTADVSGCNLSSQH